MILKVGDCLRLYAGTKDNRPGVVVRLTNNGSAVVATGTTTDRSDVKPEPVVVEFPSWEADQMGLTARTWFTARSVEILRPNTSDQFVQKYSGRCPADVFLRLAKLVGV